MKFVDRRRPDYQSYLLRLWRAGEQHTWRASLQSTATEQVYHFASVEALVAFLAAPPGACPTEGPADADG
jgi:hypothetical protein